MGTLFVGAVAAASLGTVVSASLIRALSCGPFWTRYVQVMFLVVPALLALFGGDLVEQARLGLLGVLMSAVWLGLAVYDRERRPA